MKTDKVKIIYMINSLGTGGAQMMLYRLLEKLDRKSFLPVVVALRKYPGPLQDKIEALGVKVHIVGFKNKADILALRRLYYLLKDISPSILHTQLFAADVLGRIIGRLLKTPVVITSIRNIYYGNHLRNMLIKWSDRFAKITTFVCETAARHFIKLTLVPPEKSQVIYNGLDPDLFYTGISSNEKKIIRRKLELNFEGFLLLAVGRLTKQKGYYDLLSALGDIRSDNIYKLVIAGSGPLEEELREKAEKEGLQDRVEFLGRSDNVPELMAAADGLVLSSLWEGLPGVVLEAMASELPVVATEVGGTQELVLDGATGYLVKAGTPIVLAEALQKLFDLPEKQLRSLGKAGRRRVESCFHVNNMVSAYETLYYKCLSENINCRAGSY